MKNILFAALLSACFIGQSAKAQQTKVYNKGKYQLTFISYDATLDSVEQQRLVKTFYTVYPELARTYNRNTLKAVTFVIDTTYKGVAETDNGKVTISSRWIHSHPEDIDVVTHEVMHIVQNYGESNGPGWLIEGIADYARNKFGVNNAAAKWTLPDYKPTQNYDNAYRVTARFLVWIEKKVKPGLVKEFDGRLRKHTFTDDAWRQLTGKTVDELWKTYSENPTI